MKKEIPIMFCFDKNYVMQASVAFLSLMEHANNNYLYKFYVLHSDILEEQQKKLNETIKNFKNCKIEFIDMNHRFDKEWNKYSRSNHFSKEVMYKLLVASIFPQYDKIMVSDVDVVFLGDVSEAYFTLDSIKDSEYLAGVKPIGKVKSYLNNYAKDWTKEEIDILGELCGGFLVMNLKKIREDDVEKKFIKSFADNSYRLNQMEQDILNIVCVGKIKHLHLKYVACSYMWDYYKSDEDINTDENYSRQEILEACQNPVQLHYATSIKPWKNVDCTKSEEWFKYIVKTPFLNDYLHWLPEHIVVPKQEIETKIEPQVKDSIVKKGIKYIIRHPLFFLQKDFYKKVIYYVKRRQ